MTVTLKIATKLVAETKGHVGKCPCSKCNRLAEYLAENDAQVKDGKIVTSPLQAAGIRAGRRKSKPTLAYAVKLTDSKYYTVYQRSLEETAAEVKMRVKEGAQVQWVGTCKVLKDGDHPRTTMPKKMEGLEAELFLNLVYVKPRKSPIKALSGYGKFKYTAPGFVEIHRPGQCVALCNGTVFYARPAASGKDKKSGAYRIVMPGEPTKVFTVRGETLQRIHQRAEAI